MSTRDAARKTRRQKKPDQNEFWSGVFAWLRPGDIGGHNAIDGLNHRTLKLPVKSRHRGLARMLRLERSWLCLCCRSIARRG